jgi:cell division protein FtsL
LLVAKKTEQRLAFYDLQRARKKTAEKKRSRARRAARKLGMLGTVAAAALVAILLVAHYTYVVQLTYQIDYRSAELRALQEEQQHLKLDIASLRSPERLEKIALEELGLKYPDQDQFIILTAGRTVGGRN